MFYGNDVEILQYKKSPVTFGMEIEQPPVNIRDKLIRRLYYNCHDQSAGFRIFYPDSPYDWCKS